MEKTEETKVDFDAAVQKCMECASRLLTGQSVLALERGITPEELDAVYQLASSFYGVGNYEKARELFRLLTLLNHLEKDYWFAFAAASQALKDWKSAAEAYATLTTLFDRACLEYPFRAAQCYAALGDREKAESSLTYVIEYGDPKKPEDVKLIAEAKRVLATLASGASAGGEV